MNVFFTSDLHLSHSKIIEYSNRPFVSKQEMNDVLVSNWNSKINKEDTVYFLGDFCFADQAESQSYLNLLNGKKHLIIGNHDKTAVKLDGWETISHYKEINVNGQFIVLCHYAMRVWNKSHHGAIQLYGHSHGSLPDDPNALSIDVGVDCHKFMPLSMEDIKRIMKKKTYKPVDHHGEKE